MSRLLLITLLGALPAMGLYAQTNDREHDVFVPITKYMQEGDAECLAAWMAENLELDLFGTVNECSRKQARQILDNFFENFHPKSISVVHKSLSPPMNYAVAKMNAGGERFQVTIFVKTQKNGNFIQHIRIERD